MSETIAAVVGLLFGLAVGFVLGVGVGASLRQTVDRGDQ